MLRRLIIISVVMLTALLLLLIQNKVMVGEQELQAQVTAVGAVDAGADGKLPEKRTYRVSFKDLGGSPLLATSDELEQLKNRLAGNGKQAAVKTLAISDITADHAVEVVIPTDVNELDLKRRLQGAPFHRSNDARSLFHLNYGIDLRGGVEFICQLRDENDRRVAADDEVMGVLRGRLDQRGLTEPLVAKLSNGDVQVVIPGGTRADAARTRKVLEDTGRLEFREVLAEYGRADNGAVLNNEYPGTVPGQPGCAVIMRANGNLDFAPGVYHNRGDAVAAKRTDAGIAPTHFFRLGKAALTGKDVSDASETLSEGEKAVSITFSATGAIRNQDFTTQLYQTGEFGKKSGTGRLAILFDGVVQSDPRVITPSGAHCQITGNFSKDEIDRLRTSLKAGSLSVTPVVLSERVVGATLGAETVQRALLAMVASFFAIVVFMAVYYRRLGTVANICLLVTAGLIYATMSVFNATVTLPGLAGLVLTIGMAVDTNILVFERIREELLEDKGLMYAIEHGYDRAFLTIVDAHLTTFITALILYYIGSGPVKGFGLSLMIGIVVNLFSGIYVGRLITDWLCKGRDMLSMASWIPILRLPYVRWRHLGYAFSFITGLAGALWFGFGHIILKDNFERNFDIDFTGGNMVQTIFLEAKTLDDVEKAVKSAYAAKPQELGMLKELRLQPYVSSFGATRDASRQWVFRGRDDEGSALERERDGKEEQRSILTRAATALREETPSKETEARKLDKDVDALAAEIRELQTRISARTDVFKHQIASAFPGALAAEGDDLLQATWKDLTVTMQIATLETPTVDQMARLAAALKRRDELADAQAKPLTGESGGKSGFELGVTYRAKSSIVGGIDIVDPVLTKLQTLFSAAGATPEDARAQARSAFEIYNTAVTQVGRGGLTVAKPFPSSEHFSGQVAGQMKARALIAVALSLLAILAYVAARFEFRFGIGAVISLFHDVVLTVGLISFLNIKIDLNVIAAILTIIGYSINDTIVTFDRIRENLPKLGKTLAETIDISIAQTVPRTALTSGTVILTVIVLLIFGGDALHGFTATLLIGLVLGTYSSVFVAAPLLITFQGKGLNLVPSTPAAVALAEPAEPAESVETNAGDKHQG